MSAGRLLVLVPLAYLGLFLLYPLVAILGRSLAGDGGLHIEPFRSVLGDSYYLGRIWFTIWQALVSTIFTLLVGLPTAFLFAKYEFPGKTLLKALATVPFVMPTIVVAMGFTALLGSQGILNNSFIDLFGLDTPPIRITNTLTIIFMAHAFYNYAIVVRIVSAVWANLDPALEETAKVLGAGRIRTFYHVTLPLLLPAILSSAMLAFAFSFTSFAVVLILGGSQFATLEVAIYDEIKLFRLPLAGALSVVQLVFTYLFLLLYVRFQERSEVWTNLKPQTATVRRHLGLGDKIFIAAMILSLLVILSPLIALVERALALGGGYSLSHFANLFSNERGSYFYLSPLTIIWNSLRFALATVAISLVMGTIVAYFLSRAGRRRTSILDALFMLPLGVSAVVLGLGFLIALNRPPVDLRGSWVVLVIAHSLVAYPFVIRSLLPVLRGMTPSLREAAAVMGASPARIFLFIDLPIIARALLVGATFAFAISMGEFGASLLLVRPEFTTMPVAIFRSLSQPGAANLGQALAMSSLLMAVVAVGFLAIERFRYRGLGAF